MANYLDRVIGYFNPSVGLHRAQARQALEISQDFYRDYEINSKSRRNDGWKKGNSSAAQEAHHGFINGAAAGQELCRNNPLAFRMKQTWAANTVGGGIKAEFISTNKRSSKSANTKFTQWAESTSCDFENHYNLYGLQWLWMSTVVESGGVFVRKVVNNALAFPLQLQTLEQTYLDNSKTGQKQSNGEWLLDGIQYNVDGSIKGYWLKQFIESSPYNTPVENISKFYNADEIIHIFRKERAGQHVGMTWFAQNGNMLKNHDVYIDAKLMQQKIAACFGAIVSNPQKAIGINTKTDSNGQQFDSLEPAMIEYVDAGTEITQLTPPKADNSAEFDISLQRIIAVSGGITYEMLTGDYSRVNFASGRMGKSEFFTQLDYVQKLMFLPKLNIIADWFTNLNSIVSGSKNLEVEWTFPPRAAVNPQEDFAVMFAKVRAGLMSPSEAAQLLGTKLPLVLQRWKDDKKMFDAMGLKFDIDPQYFASTGNQLDENDAASANANSQSSNNSAGNSSSADNESGDDDETS